MPIGPPEPTTLGVMAPRTASNGGPGSARQRIEIRVKPRAQVQRVGGQWGPGALLVEVQAAAVDGKANAAVVAALAVAFALPRRQITIVGGLRSRSKVVEIEGEADMVAARLVELLRAEQ